MEGVELELDDDRKGWGWAPLVGFVAGAVPLCALAGIMFLNRHRAPEPEPEGPPAVLTPAAPVAVAPRKPDAAVLAIKSTGKSRVSTVGPAAEPPPLVAGDDFGPRNPGGRAPIYVAADDSVQQYPSQRYPGQSQAQANPPRPVSGVTYREAIRADRDPLLPFGSSSDGGSYSGKSARFNPQ